MFFACPRHRLILIVVSYRSYSFETAHERVNVLKRLRLPQPEFPAGFVDAHPRQAKIISWLLQHDATRRPSAVVLLQSTLLPPKLEDEYMKDALRTIADPSTPFYHRLLSELFNSARPMPPESLQPSIADVQTPPPSHLESSVLLYVINSIQRMFQCHGGNFYPTRLLSRIDKDNPRPDSYDSVLVMDREGHLLRARSDLRSPLIDLAASGSAPERCFEIGSVYRNVSSSSALRQLLQCDFDIISGEMTHVADGEVLSMLAHILGKLIPLVPATIFVGHTAISDAILEFCSVPMSLRERVVRCISSFGPLASPDEIRNALESLLPCDLHPRLPALLLSFASTPRLLSPESQLTRLHNVLIHCRPALAAIDELSRVLDVAKLFGLSPEPTSDGNNVRVVVAPLLHIGAIYSGCISRVFVDPETTAKGTSSSGKCVGIAGRYEDVKRGVAGVGLSLGVKTFSELVLESETASRTISSNLAAHCTRVFVVSVGGEEMFAERLRIVGEIWALGESASMLMSETATLQEQVDEAEARHVQWLLTIKEKYYKADGSVRLRRLDRRQDIILARDGDIAKFFSSSSRKKM